MNAIPVLYEAYPEPALGSVVLLHGTTGTAYQRLHKDGLWYSHNTIIGFSYQDLFGIDPTPLLIHKTSEEEQ